MRTFGEFGQHDDLLGGHLVDAGQQLVGRRVQRRAAVEHVRAHALEELAHAVAGDDREHAAGVERPRGRAAVRCSTCSCMSATSSRETSPTPSNSVGRALGLVGVDVDLQRVRVADHEHGVAEPLEPRRSTAPAPGPRR